jgi:deoxyadenosine kinase
MLYESGKISELDFTTYRKLFSDMTNFLHRPDIIVYLDVDPQVAKQRILARGRECEKDLPVEYLVKLREGYEEWLTDIGRRVPVLRLDWSEFIDPKLVAGQVRAMIPNISYPV